MAFEDNTRNALTALQYESGKPLDIDSLKKVLDSYNITDIDYNDITIYKSSGENIDSPIGNESGFDSAAIHHYNEEKDINDVYYIFRGTEVDLDAPEDVVYDAFGVVAGVSDEQIEDALDFIEEVETNINTNGIKRYGDGHSLGGHLIVSVALIEKNFDDVRGLNDAPVNLKQLASLDSDFVDYLESATDVLDISDIPEEELVLLARDFYAAEANAISHTRVKGEPLYAQSIPYTFYPGASIHYLGDMETPEFPDVLTPRTPWPGLTEVFSRPPMFGTFVSLGLGINADLDRVAYNANINHLLQFITIIGEEMTVAELSELIGKAKDNPWAALSDMPESVNERLKEEVGLGHIVGGLWALKNTAVYEKVLAVINAKEQFDLHSIGTLIELYDQPGHQPVTYRLEPGTGTHILVDEDSLVNALQAMEGALEQKREALGLLYHYRNMELHERIFEQRERVEGMMSNKEANWRAFLQEAGHTYSKDAIRKPTGVTFRKEFDPVPSSAVEQIDGIIEMYELDMRELEQLVLDYKENLRGLFAADEALAQSIK
ncbi:hypothetical protein J32TS2_20030 [Shouchella clausii]|uniref:DUF6792 domain-containing protein n=3 Tax=Shouchella clausii TaxID=79880 RepID=Q5WAU6_SHOC1|nr:MULTISPECIES: DUF6792 domain-containing protein [Shouchella]MCM3311317.1 hypothetical protein [Psychrobacillus sp. MER TA 17]MBX0318954.1 hypothetical protein [Shouchella clausii]MCZ1183156.1 hypothetical protein [Shouchella clausii]MDO7284988.1 hypothetical protein [Shouchella clausii]MDO7305144.1 hypothetical protein [Shouchella clausii]